MDLGRNLECWESQSLHSTASSCSKGRPPVDLQQLKVDGVLLRDEEDVREVDNRTHLSRTARCLPSHRTFAPTSMTVRFAILKSAATDLLKLPPQHNKTGTEGPEHPGVLGITVSVAPSTEITFESCLD
eukprot:2021572-Amphidinium_carterae.1